MGAEQAHASGDVAAQLRMVSDCAAIFARGDRLVVRMVGEDRITFLHGMCSADIKGLKPGAIAYGLILTDHAHVVADLYVWADDAALYLDIDRALWADTRAHLEKFLVADDVEMEEQDELAVMDIVGPRAASAVESAIPAAAGIAPMRFIRDQDRLVGNLPRIGLAAFSVIGKKDQVEGLKEQIVRADNGIGEADRAVSEVIRMEQGIARVGVDISDKTLALEGRLERGIAFDKGCYVGQETVERATARGGVKKRLYGLRIQDSRDPRAGAAVLLDGKEVGRVSSVAVSPRLGILGLSILHHSAWKPGTAVTVKDATGSEIPAVVSELPFEQSAV